MTSNLNNGRDPREFDFAKTELAKSIEQSALNYNCSPEDMQLITKIAHRAHAEAMQRVGVELNLLMVVQDVATVHCNGCPLRLWALLASSPADFESDVSGIGLNLDKTTGKLMNGFLPRFRVVN